MSKPSTIDDYWFYPAALGITSLSALLFSAAMLSAVVRSTLAIPMSWVAGATAAALFLSMLFSTRIRNGIDAANQQLRERRRSGLGWLRLNDPEWGIAGSRSGPPLLLAVRAILFVELALSVLLSKWIGNEIGLVALSGMFVATMLSIIHVSLTTRR